MAQLDLGKVMGSRIHNVSGAPEATLGLVNDWALDTGSGAVYEKTATGWTSRGSFKGDQGESGAKGDDGAAAGFGTVSATVDANVGTPSVTVSADGADTAKNFSFSFQNLKGEKGDTGAAGADGADGQTPILSIDDEGHLIATYGE